MGETYFIRHLPTDLFAFFDPFPLKTYAAFFIQHGATNLPHAHRSHGQVAKPENDILADYFQKILLTDSLLRKWIQILKYLDQ